MFLAQCRKCILMVCHQVIPPPRKSMTLVPVNVYDSSTGVLVTVVESNNSTIAISTPKNTMDQDTSCREIGLLIVYFCLIALVIMIATVFFLAKIRQRPKSQRKQGTKPSFEMELLSPPNAV